MTVFMMAPAATTPVAPTKTGAFDIATLFVADKAVRDESSLNLATVVKREGVEYLASIQFNDAIVKVCTRFFPPGTPHANEARADFPI